MSQVVVDNKIPIFKQVARLIKNRIRSEGYCSGKYLPSLRSMGDEYGVSRAVVHRAIRSLEQEGIVNVRQGKGVVLVDGDICKKSVFLFGLIHPYEESSTFAYRIIGNTQKAFARQSNLVVANSSFDSSDAERKIAEHFIEHGVQGLLVWPTSNDRNGDFFVDISHKIPVVLVDRMFSGINLPTVVMNYYDCGVDVCNYAFQERKRKRLLVIIDNLEISTYQDITRGIEDRARSIGYFHEVTFVRLPVSRMIQQYLLNEFTEIIECGNYIKRILSEGHYDSVFAFQDQFIDYVVAQQDLLLDCENIDLMTMRGVREDDHSMKYKLLKPVTWTVDMQEMLNISADHLHDCLLGKNESIGVKTIKITKSC